MNQLIGTQEFDNVVRSANQIIDAVSALLHPRDADGDTEGITPTIQELNVLAAIEIYKESLKLAGYGYAEAAPNDYMPAPPKRKRPKRQYTLMEPPEDDERRYEIVADAVHLIDKGRNIDSVKNSLIRIYSLLNEHALAYVCLAMIEAFPTRATDPTDENPIGGPYCFTSPLTQYILANCFPGEFHSFGVSTMARSGKIYVRMSEITDSSLPVAKKICAMYGLKFMGK